MIGPLSLLCEQLNEPFLILNGDALIDLNLKRIRELSSSTATLTTATANPPRRWTLA